MRRRQRGFSLIELLIVVAIILIIAAISIPNLTKTRISPNEASAVASVQTIIKAQQMYASQHPDLGFTCSLAELGPSSGSSGSSGAGIIDGALASGTKSGYNIALTDCTGGTNQPKVTYFISATPIVDNQTGIRRFCSDQSGQVHYAGLGETCDPNNSKPLQ